MTTRNLESSRQLCLDTNAGCSLVNLKAEHLGQFNSIHHVISTPDIVSMPPNGTGLAITNPLVLYRSLIATQKIRPDPGQHRLGEL
jgi:hypothetical protein